MALPRPVGEPSMSEMRGEPSAFRSDHAEVVEAKMSSSGKPLVLCCVSRQFQKARPLMVTEVQESRLKRGSDTTPRSVVDLTVGLTARRMSAASAPVRRRAPRIRGCMLAEN